MIRWSTALREVCAAEWGLLRQHRKLAIAWAGLLFVPALYAWIYLVAMWDPASHTRDLPAGLVNLDTGAQYRARQLNLGDEVLRGIEREGHFAYRRYADPQAAQADVRRGVLAFMLEVPADFTQRALPGARAGDATLRIVTSEGNHTTSAGFARRFAPEVAQRVNTLLNETRWNLVLSTADGSQRNLETLHAALADLHRGSTELTLGLQKARDGSLPLQQGQATAAEAAQRLRTGALGLADAQAQLGDGVRQFGSALRALEARRPPEAELNALRQGSRAQAEGQRELARGLDTLAGGARQLHAGLGQLKESADEIPLWGSRLLEGITPLHEGAALLGEGLVQARDGAQRLQQGAARLEDGVASLADGVQRAGSSLSALSARLPDDARVEALADGARELARGHDALGSGLRQLGAGQATLSTGLARLADGAGQLETGLELVRRSLPQSVERPDGSPQGLALSVRAELEVLAPVANQGVALTPNFVPLALWVGAVMAAFLVHLRRVPVALQHHPRSALAAGKLALPMAAVLVQATVMLVMLAGVLHVPMPRPGLFAFTLALTSVCFLSLVWLLVRAVGDLGKVLAVLLFIVQVSGAGALIPIELNDPTFQALHPFLPLTWVVRAFRASLFGAFDGEAGPALAVLAGVTALCLALGVWIGRWRGVEPVMWRPPLDIE